MPASTSSTRRSSTSRSCATEARGARRPARPRPGRGLRAVLAALVLAALAALVPAPASAKPKPVLLTLSGPGGERSVEATDLHFVYYSTRYRRTRAPVEESPTRERLEVLSDREDCECVRFADYSRVKLKKVREIEVVVAPGEPVATVRVTRLDGRTNAYPATGLWGGDSLFPPFIAATIDGVVREFALVLEAGDGSWPEEMLVRALLVRSPPPKGQRH